MNKFFVFTLLAINTFADCSEPETPKSPRAVRARSNSKAVHWGQDESHEFTPDALEKKAMHRTRWERFTMKRGSSDEAYWANEPENAS